MTKYLIGTIIVLGVALGFSIRQTSKMAEKRNIAEANVKAYSSLLDEEKAQNKGLQLTVDQLEYFNDSILKKLDNTRKELAVKDKELKALQYVSSLFVKADTIVVKDTLFKDPDFKMDTLIYDGWYSLELEMEYPSTISTKTSFRSEKHIVVSSKKETVNPPKKWWLLRLFQKKHRVVQVDVIEKNPHIVDENNRYVEIIK